MAETYSAGIVTAYGAAVRGGYTGTYEQFCADQAQFGANAAKVAQDRAAVEAATETFTTETVPGAVQTVQQTGATQVQAVEAASETEQQQIALAGAAQETRVTQAGDDQVDAVEEAGATQVGNVNTAGTTQVGAVNTAGATQVQAVEDKGQEVIDSIPADYTELSDDVADLKSAISNIKSNTGYEHLIQAVKPFRIPETVQAIDVTEKTAWTGLDATIGDPTTIYDNVNRCNVNAIPITSTSNGIAYCDLESAVDVTNKPVAISVYLDKTSLDAESGNAKSVFLVLYSGNGRSSGYRADVNIQYEGGNASFDSVYCRNGWFHLCFFPTSGVMERSGSSFDPTNVTAIGVKISHASGTTRRIYVSDLRVVSPMQKPGIITIVDNFGTQVPDMADYAISKGVRLNLSIIPGFYAGVSGAPTSASESELERIAAQGHFIWNHTWTHQVFNSLTDLQIHEQVNLAETWMQKKGYEYSRGAEFVSVPSAQFNTDSADSLLDTNAQMIFHKWMTPMRHFVFMPYYACLRMLPTTMLDSSSTQTSGVELAAIAAKASTYNGIAVMGFHGTYWDRDSGDSWKAYIDAIAQSGLYSYGLDEIYNGQWC